MTIVDDISVEARAKRLREARVRLYPSAAKAAEALNLKAVTVRSHENGQNGFPLSSANQYAEAYGVSLEWLLAGRDDGEAPSPAKAVAAKPAAPLTMTTLPNGKARLEMNLVLPFADALRVLAIVEEAHKS